DDAAPERRNELAHGVQHAGIIKTVGARLNEYIPHQPQAPRQLDIALDRLIRWLVTDVGAVGIFFSRAEYVEMGIAGVWGRGKGLLKARIGIVRGHLIHG